MHEKSSHDSFINTVRNAAIPACHIKRILYLAKIELFYRVSMGEHIKIGIFDSESIKFDTLRDRENV